MQANYKVERIEITSDMTYPNTNQDGSPDFTQPVAVERRVFHLRHENTLDNTLCILMVATRDTNIWSSFEMGATVTVTCSPQE